MALYLGTIEDARCVTFQDLIWIISVTISVIVITVLITAITIVVLTMKFHKYSGLKTSTRVSNLLARIIS